MRFFYPHAGPRWTREIARDPVASVIQHRPDFLERGWRGNNVQQRKLSSQTPRLLHRVIDCPFRILRKIGWAHEMTEVKFQATGRLSCQILRGFNNTSSY